MRLRSGREGAAKEHTSTTPQMTGDWWHKQDPEMGQRPAGAGTQTRSGRGQTAERPKARNRPRGRAPAKPASWPRNSQ